MTHEEQVRAVQDARQLLESRGWNLHARKFIDTYVNAETQTLLSKRRDREQELWVRGGIDALVQLVQYLENKAMARTLGKRQRTETEPADTQSAFARL